MKKALLSLLILIHFVAHSQITINNSFELKIKKVKKAPKILHSTQNVKIEEDDFQKILIRSNIKSLKKEKLDINPFSVIDTINKIRYRLVDFVAYKFISKGPSGYQSPELLKTNLLNDKGKPYKGLPKYNPKIRDTFYDYKFEGYTNFDEPFNFGNRKNPLISKIYYKPVTIKRKYIADLFFAINKKNKGFYQLYYGKRKIADLKFNFL